MAPCLGVCSHSRLFVLRRTVRCAAQLKDYPRGPGSSRPARRRAKLQPAPVPATTHSNPDGSVTYTFDEEEESFEQLLTSGVRQFSGDLNRRNGSTAGQQLKSLDSASRAVSHAQRREDHSGHVQLLQSVDRPRDASSLSTPTASTSGSNGSSSSNGSNGSVRHNGARHVAANNNRSAHSVVLAHRYQATGSGRGLRDIERHQDALSGQLAPVLPRDLLVGSLAQLRGGDLAEALDVGRADAMTLLAAFSDFAKIGRLESALKVVEACVQARRHDVLSRLLHRHFLRPAAAAGAVKEALRFVQLLPRGYVDARTYNMLITVCVRARDLTNALHAADMMKSTGRKLDTVLYTNLITACAAASNADMAFKLYSEMKAERVPATKHTFAATISACANRIGRLPPAERRLQLVVLERAFGVFEDMRAQAAEADVAVYNALITAAGRTGQLQRAFQVLEDMEGHGYPPNARTYATLIEACSTAGEGDLAIRVYHRALMGGATDNLIIYSNAITACCCTKQRADLKMAMQIYADMQRNGVQADPMLYAGLMHVAGAAGSLDLAFELLEEMQGEGLKPTQATYSALIQACLLNKHLDRAREQYQVVRKRGMMPSLATVNALIKGCGEACHLGDAVAAVVDMLAAGLRPDAVTYSAILTACQYANEAELAFDIYRIMKLKGVPVDSIHSVQLARMCFTRSREAWRPGGYPPGPPTRTPRLASQQRSPPAQALLEALAGRTRLPDPARMEAINWDARALAVYREVLASGFLPELNLLNFVLACLRIPLEPAESQQKELPVDDMPYTGKGPARKPRLLLSEPPESSASAAAEAAGGGPPEPRVSTIRRVYDQRALTIVEEAVAIGVLPQFRLDHSSTIDLREMPPAVAEVYVLVILHALQRGLSAPHSAFEHTITLQVGPYDPADIFLLSYMATESELPHELGFTPSAAAAEDPTSGLSRAKKSSATGLGVAGIMRQVGMFATERPAEGELEMSSAELTRWVRWANRRKGKVASQSVNSQLSEPSWPGSGVGSGIAEQQRRIRMGKGVPRPEF